MKTSLPLIAGLIGASSAAFAVDYHVDFTRMQDYEKLRPLIEGCKDYDSLELYRDKMHTIANLNDMTYVFDGAGFGLFNDCPDGIAGDGIEPLK